MSSSKELSPKETFLSGLINPIYAYVGEREPVHCRLSPETKMYNYIGVLQKQKLTKLPTDMNMPAIVSSFPLLQSTQHHSPLLFKELIQELKEKISHYATVNEELQKSNAFMQFGRKVVKIAKDTLWHTDNHFQKLIHELNKILDDANISTIENELSNTANTIAAERKPQTPIGSMGVFANVPIDIIYEIFKHLDVESTTKRNQVCRFFNSLNGKTLWQSYLNHDFQDAVTNQPDDYKNSPQALYIARYLKKKHTPVIHLPLIVEPDSLSIVNNDPVRLLNRIFANNQLRDIDSKMLKPSIPEAIGVIGSILAASYFTKEESHIRQSKYAILGFDSKMNFNTSVNVNKNVAQHMVEIAFTDYRFRQNDDFFFDYDLDLLLRNRCTLSCNRTPVRFNGKIFEKVNVPGLAVENKAEATVKYKLS